ncbi:MAG: TonB-dependent receptor [Janthinobacterium lividum]
MTASSPRTRSTTWQPLVLAIATASLPLAVLAQSDATLNPVQVTASRFAADPSFAPIGATVITADEIREAGIGNVNEAIRKIGGVFGRQSTTGSTDFSLDLRGFGATSDQNMVILVDGVRLSENELATAMLSSVPIETVERIEITRGGSSVLYGDGATGGVIQIITKRTARDGVHGTVVAEVGTLGLRELRGSVAKGWDGFSLDANVGTMESDNYRANNAIRQSNFSGGLQYGDNTGRIGFRADVARQDTHLAGSLTLAQFNADPRQTNTPDDFGSLDSNRYTLFAERRFGGLELASELSYRDKTSRYASTGYSSKADSHVMQFSPRLRYLSDLAAARNELVAGVDLANYKRDTNTTFVRATGEQKSMAFYLRDEVRFGALRVALGARHEKFDKKADDPTSAAYDGSQSANAWDLLASYTVVRNVDVFAKAGKSYRVANIDENNYTPVIGKPLETQTSHDLELGTMLGNAEGNLTARVFRHKLRNEIYYDPTVPGQFFPGANANLDPTRHQGIELDAAMRVIPGVTLHAVLQHVSARFTEGPNAGKELGLVPKNTATVRANWVAGNGQSADVGVQWVDTQRYGGDFDNSCSAKIPSYTTIDARYAVRVSNWTFALSGTNLADKDFFSSAYGSCNSGIYSENGRQLKLSARYDF